MWNFFHSNNLYETYKADFFDIRCITVCKIKPRQNLYSALLQWNKTIQNFWWYFHLKRGMYSLYSVGSTYNLTWSDSYWTHKCFAIAFCLGINSQHYLDTAVGTLPVTISSVASKQHCESMLCGKRTMQCFRGFHMSGFSSLVSWIGSSGETYSTFWVRVRPYSTTMTMDFRHSFDANLNKYSIRRHC